MNNKTIFSRAIIKDNPVFILLLGLCPALGVTTSAFNGFCMFVATLFVLVMSNIVVSIIKDFIPNKVRIPCFIVIIATFVTITDLVMAAFVPALYDALGLFIPLIVCNCLVLGRAEAFASRNTLFKSIIDGLGMGVGFTFALALIGFVRELFGNYSVLGFKFIEGDGMLVFVLAPGAFLAMAYLIAIMGRFSKN